MTQVKVKQKLMFTQGVHNSIIKCIENSGGIERASWEEQELLDIYAERIHKLKKDIANIELEMKVQR